MPRDVRTRRPRHCGLRAVARSTPSAPSTILPQRRGEADGPGGQGLELFNASEVRGVSHEPARTPESHPCSQTSVRQPGLPKNPKNRSTACRGSGIRTERNGGSRSGGYLKEAKYKPAEYESQWANTKCRRCATSTGGPPRDGEGLRHNGYFKSLEQIVSFYNTATWASGRHRKCQRTSTDAARQPGLTADEEAAVVAFLTTLTDGYVPAGK